MKVILLKDVPGTGRAHEVKEVAPGFAGNFLIPNKLCVVATAASLKAAEEKRVRAEAERKVAEDLAHKNLEALSGAKITLTEKANEERHLFASIHKDEIAEAIKKQLKLDIPKEAIHLEKPIKTLGEAAVEVSLHGKKVSFTVVVDQA